MDTQLEPEGKGMLVLDRREKEVIVIDHKIRLTVVSAQNGRVKIGIEAPREISVNRLEVKERDKHEAAPAA